MRSSFYLLVTLCALTSHLSADFKKSPAPSSSTPKVKPHYAGARRQPTKEKVEKPIKKRSKIKNEWVSSKTHPKVVEKHSEDKAEFLEELPEDRPYFQRANYLLEGVTPTPNNTAARLNRLESQVEELQEEKFYPRQGFQAPRGHVYLTGDGLFWRARQEGMEYATGKSVHFDYTSGFRAGLGVHLPTDGWDIYANYTRVAPHHSNGIEGQTFPQLLYGATFFVDRAHADWKITFQSADLEIGRVYFLSCSLILRPYFGLKGGWIDQNAKITYQGGIVPEGQEYTVHYKNDFKGAGPRIGFQSNWDLGVGFSFFSDMAASFLIGIFNNHQVQKQFNGTEPIQLKTHQHLVSPNLQLVAGLGWDRNFHRDHCHFGISAGFEAQIYWSQNQIEKFTTAAQPNYVRVDGDLSFYGLTLRSRFDF